ncbi:MAG: MIP/aquaporin family protein [Candidatus Baltobacteraceae bacterium]
MATSSESAAGWRRGLSGELLAEFIGTFALLAFGIGCVAVAVVGLTMSGRTNVIFEGAGGWLLITWGWAIAVVMGVYVAGGVSGAHLNPAVSLAFAVRGDFPWAKVIPYWIAQTAGAFCGAAIVYLDYYTSIDAWNLAHHVASRMDPGGAVTFSIFATLPAAPFGTSPVGPLIDQIIGTFFLLLFIFGISDARNLGVQANLGPYIVGLAVAAIGMSFGTDAGYAINPARDFGPRLFTWLAGWGANAFPGPGANGYFWVPIVGPLIGGAIAPFVYEFFIGATLRARGSPAISDAVAVEGPVPGGPVVVER